MDSLRKCAECSKPSELKCSGCKAVSYCSADHQRKHWKVHKDACRPYEISSSPELGRYLIAKRDLCKGDVISIEYPIAYGPKLHLEKNEKMGICPGCCCSISLETAARCDGCGWPVCNPNCPGLKSENAHKLECILLQLRKGCAINNMYDYYRLDALFPLRCLILQRKQKKKFEELLKMESHLDERGEGTDIYDILQKRVVKYLTDNFIVPLKEIEAESGSVMFPEVSERIIHKICGVIDVNCLEISQNGVEISALYQIGCLAEHNCLPNTYYEFNSDDNYKLKMKAATNIKKGEHISTIYTNILWGTQARRDHLKFTKYFDCTCERCEDPTEFGSYMSALKCLGTEEMGPCDGIQLPLNSLDEETEWFCSKCPVKLSNGHVSLLVSQMGEEIDKVQMYNPSVKELNALLDKTSKFLHPNHYHNYAIKHSLIQLYGHQQGYLPNDLSDETLIHKADICRELVKITEKIDPTCTRLQLYLGVILHELYLANFYFVERKWASCPDAEPLQRKLNEGKEVLIKAKHILSDEKVRFETGRKLYDLISKSLINLEKWAVVLDIDF